MSNNISKKLKILVFTIGLLSLFSFWMHYSETALMHYYKYIFQPIQAIKACLFSVITWSVGDVFYVFMGIVFFVAIIRVVIPIFRKQFITSGVELIRLLNLALIIYFAFMLSWGGNYARQPLYSNYLATYQKHVAVDSSKQTHQWDVDTLAIFIGNLVAQLNHIDQETDINTPKTAQQISDDSEALYHQFLQKGFLTNSLKPSFLGDKIQYLGIQGYFNPFSGEGQYATNLESCIEPFVFVHEMAHQVGIASETDANLLAYLLCTHSDKLYLQYSAKLNLLLYALGDLKRIDKNRIQPLLMNLNGNSQQHLDDIEAARRKYSSGFRKFSMTFYDGFLKHFGQKEGLRSYSRMAYKVYLLEQKQLDASQLFSVF